jgi:hypothetical protein
MNAAVRFGRFSCVLEDEGLRGMKASQVCCAPCRLIEMNVEYGTRFPQQRLRFFELARGFRLYRSSPSCLISCMSGVRSCKAATR